VAVSRCTRPGRYAWDASCQGVEAHKSKGQAARHATSLYDHAHTSIDLMLSR